MALRWQKSMKSKAKLLGRIARLAWTYPGAIPAVGRTSSPSRISARSSLGVVGIAVACI